MSFFNSERIREPTCRRGCGATNSPQTRVCGLKNISASYEVIGKPRELLLKRVSAVPRPQSDHPSGACCSELISDTPFLSSFAGLDRVRRVRHSRQPGW